MSRDAAKLGKTALVALAFLAVTTIFAAPSFGQSVDTSSPIVVKQTKIKPVWLKAEVIHGDRQSLMVREVEHPMNVHTFTYSAKAKDQMDNVLANGGYHRGDKVKVSYQPGQTVALSIKGKPSPE